MDSEAIATELEARHPQPSLRRNPELEKEVNEARMGIFVAVIPYLAVMAVDNLVAPEDIEWFKADRAPRFGTTVDEMFGTKKEAAPFYAAAQPSFEKCAELLRKHKIDEGPFILGSEPCYGDFSLVALMQMFYQAGEHEWAKFIEACPVEMRRLHEACRPWTAADGREG